jgi:hypothetical protein
MSPLLERDFQFQSPQKFVRDGETIAVDKTSTNHSSIARNHRLGEESDQFNSLGRKVEVDDAGFMHSSRGAIIITGSPTTCCLRPSGINAREETARIVAEITKRRVISED